jgi:high-affinity iron transporter
MLLNSIVIVLREVLEAALLVSILLALARIHGLGTRWLLPVLVIGGTGAVLYGMHMATVSAWFDGVGQELANALLQGSVFALLLRIGFLSCAARTEDARRHAPLTRAMALAVALASVREGSEIHLYLSGFLSQPGHSAGVALGAVLGAGIGFSIGALFYYFLLALAQPHAIRLAAALLALIGAGMAMQATSALIQADWLPAQAPLWDTSPWLAEHSLTGQLLYALIGYEATPGALQVGVYVGSLILMTLVIRRATRRIAS